jgi:hypothetical protein
LAHWTTLVGFAWAAVLFAAETTRFWPDTAWEIRFMIRSGKDEPQSGQTYGQTKLAKRAIPVGERESDTPA